MDDDGPFYYTAEPSMNQMQLLNELRILHDHFAGQFKTLPMQTCHNAMTRIKELEDKLGDAEQRIDNLCTALESSGKGHAAKDDALRSLESRLQGYVDQYNAAQDDHAKVVAGYASRLEEAKKALAGAGIHFEQEIGSITIGAVERGALKS